jgi:hypothetical protein
VQGDTIRVTLLVTDALDQLGITYAVGGSLASSLHGVMRSTLDVDLLADIRPEHIERIVEKLSQEFYADDEMMLDAIQHRSSFNLIHYATSFKVDSIIAVDPDRSVFVASPEDTILAKLEWYRLGGEVSDRQWRDLLGVIKTKSGTLDREYLHRWARELEVMDLLERALEQA